MPPTPPSVHHIFSRPISDGAVHMRHRGTRRAAPRQASVSGWKPTGNENERHRDHTQNPLGNTNIGVERATNSNARTRPKPQSSRASLARAPTAARARCSPHSRAPCFRRKENLQKHRFSRRLATSETAKLEWLALIKYCYCPTCGSAHVIGRRVFIRARVQYLYYCTDQF